MLPCNQCKKLAEHNKPARCAYARIPASSHQVIDDGRVDEGHNQVPSFAISETGSDVSQTRHSVPTSAYIDEVTELRQRVVHIEQLSAIQSPA